jgi:hypothetical protein
MFASVGRSCIRNLNAPVPPCRHQQFKLHGQAAFQGTNLPSPALLGTWIWSIRPRPALSVPGAALGHAVANKAGSEQRRSGLFRACVGNGVVKAATLSLLTGVAVEHGAGVPAKTVRTEVFPL